MNPSRCSLHLPSHVASSRFLRRPAVGAAAALALALLLSTQPAGGADREIESPQPARRTGTVRYEVPSRGEDQVAARFRLPAHEFHYEREAFPEVSQRIAIDQVRFPSPVQTTVTANNTVHCEFFYPRKEGKVPAVVVLHILGGDFDLARLFANNLAQHGVAALFLKMPYYGPRRDPQSTRRMISQDPRETVEGLTQAVLDIRQAIAWLAAQPNVDASQLGVFGISLGGITGALAATAEPRIQNICLLLAGGDLPRIAWESKELAKLRDTWLAEGRSRDEFITLMSEVDPARYGANVRGRRILMLNARDDEVVPRVCTEALWESFGRPELVWYTGGHYSVARHVFTALHRTGQFFSTAE